MFIKTIVNSIYAENTYLLADESGDTALIDCGCVTQRDRDTLQQILQPYRLKKVLNTHLHPDHICGNAFLQDTYHIGYACHRDDLFLAQNAIHYGSELGMRMDPQPLPETFLEDGDTVTFGNTKLQVIATPGHSPGCICFYNQEESVLFSGDTLFCNSIGRSDLWGGNGPQLLQSIREKIFTLPPDTTVYPGHGEPTTVGYEMKYNPYL